MKTKPTFVVSTPAQDALKHMLGLTNRKALPGYRNYYADGYPKISDALLELEKAGFARRGKVINTPPNELIYFHATEAGMKFLNMPAAAIKRALEL
jgi:hypothetical protein